MTGEATTNAPPNKPPSQTKIGGKKRMGSQLKNNIIGQITKRFIVSFFIIML